MCLGLASYEYLEGHELTSSRPTHLLVVPADGRKDELDAWLEGSVASAQTKVATYDVEYREHRRGVQGLVVGFAVVGCVTAIVAAIALAVLNYIFVSQRQSEFGVLHALGYGRLRLVGRTVRETAFTTGAAWGLSAILCLIGLLYLQFGVFTPLGLRLNLFNLTPWLFTLPIPIAVLAATTGTVARTLSKLDPVSIIERR
jgi:hypothetical protein